MSKIFEDEFMEIQADIVSVCLEATEGNADKIFGYCSMEECVFYFNACFEVNGKIKRVDQLDVDDNTQWMILRTGTDKLMDLRDICEKHKMRRPTEIKMVYDVRTGKFNANYKYEPVCEDDDVFQSDIYLAWVEELKQSYE